MIGTFITRKDGAVFGDGSFGGDVSIAGQLTLGSLATPYGNTRIVSKSGSDYSSIQAAIDSITDNATDNRYSVIVYPGTYEENIVMKDYVNVTGIDGRRGTKVIGSSGTLLTMSANESHWSWIDLAMTPTADGDIVIDATAGNGVTGFYRLEHIDVSMVSAVDGINPTVIDANVGVGIYLISDSISYTMTGTAGAGTHAPINLQTTNNLCYLLRSIARGTVSAGSGNLATINDQSTGRLLLEIATVEATFAGSSGGICTPVAVYGGGTGQGIKQVNTAVLNCTGNAAGSGYAVYFDTTTNDGELNASRNLYTVSGFSNNYRYNVGTGDELFSYFNRSASDIADVISGTSHNADVCSDGSLRVSDDVIVGAVGAPIVPLQVESDLNALTDTDEPENYHVLIRRNSDSNDVGMGVAFLGSTSTNDVGAGIIYKRTGSNAQGELQLWNKQNTTPDGTMTQAITVTDAGAVGIGETSPTEKLQVGGGSGNRFFGQTSSGAAVMVMGNADGGVDNKYSFMAMSAGGNVFWGGMADDLSTRNEKMRLTSAGNLGIKTSSHTAALSVNGGANIGGDSDPGDNNLSVDGYTIESHDDVTATSDGVAASVSTAITYVTTNGDSDLDNVTLADGVEGQTKSIACVSEGNAADTWKITPANLIGGTQITFNGVGEGCILKMHSAGWVVVGNNGGTIS